MLGLNIRRAELASFVACEKDDAPGFLRIAFKHMPFPLTFPAGNRKPTLPDHPPHYATKGPPNPSPESSSNHVTEGIPSVFPPGRKPRFLKRLGCTLSPLRGWTSRR